MKQAIVSISVEKPLLKRARKAAKDRRQTFSGYLCTLIDLDVRKGSVEKTKAA